MKLRAMNQLLAEGKVRLQYCGKGEEIIGLCVGTVAQPSLEDLASLAKELDHAGVEEGVRYRLLLGDTISAMEALPEVRKKDLVNATFAIFGEENVYCRLRKYMHVARAFPASALLSDGSVRRRTDVAWCVLQEVAPRWVPDVLRQQILDEAVAGRLTIKDIRQRLETCRPASKQPVRPRAKRPCGRDDIDDILGDERPERCSDAARVPEPIPHFHIAQGLRPILKALAQRAQLERAVNVLFVGDAGAGKTSLARQYAAETGRPFFVFNCGTVREVSDFWGTREAQKGRTFFRPSTLVRTLTLGNAVVVFDEINRLPAHLLNPLLGLLDDRRETETPAGLNVRVAPGTILVGTANIGEGYAGTFRMDRALLDRFQGNILPIPAPSETTIQAALVGRTGCSAPQAEMLLRIAARINGADLPIKIGTRALLQAGHWLAAGLGFDAACELAFLNGCALLDGAGRETVETILDGLLGDRTGAITDLVGTLAHMAASRAAA